MALYFIHRSFLTDTPLLLLGISIFSLVFTVPIHNLCASNEASTFADMPTGSNEIFDNQLTRDERRQRIGQMLEYVQKQGPHWLPGLAPVLQDPSGWVQRHLGFTSVGLGFFQERRVDDNGSSNNNFLDMMRPVADVIRPVSALMLAPPSEDNQAMWLSPNYHHKEFLPAKDAMVMGFTMRQRLWDNMAQFDTHPFYGQGWRNSTSYWGTEMVIDLGVLAITPTATSGKPWGKIALRYTNGERELMDNSHGIDLRSEFNFMDGMSFNAGVRENDDYQKDSYIMLRWKKIFDR